MNFFFTQKTMFVLSKKQEKTQKQLALHIDHLTKVILSETYFFFSLLKIFTFQPSCFSCLMTRAQGAARQIIHIVFFGCIPLHITRTGPTPSIPLFFYAHQCVVLCFYCRFLLSSLVSHSLYSRLLLSSPASHTLYNDDHRCTRTRN